MGYRTFNLLNKGDKHDQTPILTLTTSTITQT